MSHLDIQIQICKDIHAEFTPVKSTPCRKKSVNEQIAHRDSEQLENTNHVFTGIKKQKNIAGGIQNACRLFDLFSQPPLEFIFKDV